MFELQLYDIHNDNNVCEHSYTAENEPIQKHKHFRWEIIHMHHFSMYKWHISYDIIVVFYNKTFNLYYTWFYIVGKYSLNYLNTSTTWANLLSFWFSNMLIISYMKNYLYNHLLLWIHILTLSHLFDDYEREISLPNLSSPKTPLPLPTPECRPKFTPNAPSDGLNVIAF